MPSHQHLQWLCLLPRHPEIQSLNASGQGTHHEVDCRTLAPARAAMWQDAPSLLHRLAQHDEHHDAITKEASESGLVL